MDKAKRAQTAETLKQPSLRLRLRAPHLYPDPGKRSIWKAAGARFVIPLKPGNAVIHPLIKLAGS